jgi:alpha-beta hydrolase superfamily lysophospholipase
MRKSIIGHEHHPIRRLLASRMGFPMPGNSKNRARARQAAASAILELVQKIRSTAGNEQIFLIGHSHGGSAISYFLKEHSEAAKTPSGCAFLSTPFVAVRPRSQALRLIVVTARHQCDALPKASVQLPQ